MSHLRRRRRRIQYYSGESSRARLRDRVWFPFVMVAMLALVLALVIGAILGGLADKSLLSSVTPKPLVDMGGVDKPEEKYAALTVITGDAVDTTGLDGDALEDVLRELPEGNAVAFTLYNGAGKVYFDADLAKKTDGIAVASTIPVGEIANVARDGERYGVGVFVTDALRENDDQLRILETSREIALLGEIAGAGFREIVIVGLPSDSDKAEAVNEYLRQAKQTCGSVTLGVAISGEDADSSGISRLVAYTEQYADSYYLDLRGATSAQAASRTERNAYFLTAYNMRVMLRGSERQALLDHAATYGFQSYLIFP